MCGGGGGEHGGGGASQLLTLLAVQVRAGEQLLCAERRAPGAGRRDPGAGRRTPSPAARWRTQGPAPWQLLAAPLSRR